MRCFWESLESDIEEPYEISFKRLMTPVVKATCNQIQWTLEIAFKSHMTLLSRVVWARFPHSLKSSSKIFGIIFKGLRNPFHFFSDFQFQNHVKSICGGLSKSASRIFWNRLQVTLEKRYWFKEVSATDFASPLTSIASDTSAATSQLPCYNFKNISNRTLASLENQLQRVLCSEIESERLKEGSSEGGKEG